MNNNKKHSFQGYWTSSLMNTKPCNRTDQTSETLIVTRVVGVTFEGRQHVVAKLQVGEQIVLRREPHNPFDANAIRVERLTCEQIGYIDRYKAASLAPLYDACGGIGYGTVLQLIGSYSNGMALGVVIGFTVPHQTLHTGGGYANA